MNTIPFKDEAARLEVRYLPETAHANLLA